MNVKCSCGGRFRRTDVVPVRQHHGRAELMYQDTDAKVAHWKCDRCDARREQRKRQAK